MDWFFFVSFTSKEVVNSVNRTATAYTTWDPITGMSTRGLRVSDFGNGKRFLFRYIGADAFNDTKYQNSSIIEVYNAFNPIRL